VIGCLGQGPAEGGDRPSESLFMKKLKSDKQFPIFLQLRCTAYKYLRLRVSSLRFRRSSLLFGFRSHQPPRRPSRFRLLVVLIKIAKFCIRNLPPGLLVIKQHFLSITLAVTLYKTLVTYVLVKVTSP